MVDQNMSEAEEMYLITLAKLAEGGVQGPVPLAVLAEELDVLPVSANQMVHKLKQVGIVDYVPYKGVELKSEGQKLANRTLRKRRLWELFLIEKLGLAFEQADALACRMEHISSDEVTEKLAAFLGNPARSSRGLPIPPAEGDKPLVEEPLSRAEAGRSYTVSAIGDEILREFLAANEIAEGTKLKLLATSSHGDVLLDVEGAHVNLAAETAAQVMVCEELG
jgi:DtxR family Mn-dependent transcriptional regulator